MTLFVPAVATSATSTPACFAIKPMTENITNPAKMDVPQLIIGIMMASLQTKQLCFYDELREIFFQLHAYLFTHKIMPTTPLVCSFFVMSGCFSEIAPK